MTIEEKLERCVQFIQKVEHVDTDMFDEDAVEMLDQLKNEAWHVLADLAE